MRKTVSTFYALAKWFILLLLLIGALVVFIIESPSTVLTLIKEPLKEQGLTYGTMKGGLLSGFTLYDVNYNNQVQAKELRLKVDFEALKKRVLVIDDLGLFELEIDKNFLTTLIDTNRTEEPKKEGNLTLPFDKILVKKAEISIKNTGYQNYYIHWAKLNIKNLESDMKKRHKGQLSLLLESNITKADINASFVNETYDIVAKIEGERTFINPFITEHNLTLLINPKLNLKAKGDLDLVNYKVDIDALELQQNDYRVKSKSFKSFGSFNIAQNYLINHLATELDGNVAYLKLNSQSSLDLNDINNSLKFNIKSKIKPKKSMLSLLLSEQNITIQNSPQISLNTEGTLKQLSFFTTIKGLKAKWEKIYLNLKHLELKGDAKPLQGDITSKLMTQFNSSIASGAIHLKSQLNYKDINNSLNFNLNSNLKSHKKFLTKMVKDAKIVMKSDGKIHLQAKGDMKRVIFSSEIENFRGEEKEIAFNLKKLSIKGKAKPLKGDIDIKLISQFSSSVASGDMDLKSRLNYKDINNSLTFDFKSNLKSHKRFLTKMLKDANLTLKSDSSISLMAKGTLKSLFFSTDIKNFRAKQNNIDIYLKRVSLKGDTEPLKGDTKANLRVKFNSTVADGEINGDTKLNFKDINNSLHFSMKTGLQVHDKYLNSFLKDANISLRGESDIKLEAEGGINKIQSKFSLDSKVFAQNILSDLTLRSSKVDIDLKKHYIDGDLKLNSKAPNLALTLQSRFFGDYTKPKKMRIKGNIVVQRFNAFNINLDTLTPLRFHIDKSKNNLFAKLNSNKLQFSARSPDLNRIQFHIKSKNIYPSKIVELPESLQNQFIALNLNGSLTISKEYFNIKGYLHSNKNFKVHLNAKNGAKGLSALLATKHLKLKATGDIKKRHLNTELKIDSITKVQKEFTKLYPFEIIPVDGKLALKAKIRGERVAVNLTSRKLKLEGFNIENIDLDANYKPDLITINRLNMETTGFADAKLNKKIFLNRKGEIHLGKKRDILLDIHPKILVDIKGREENLNGSLKIDALPLGHPEYGEVILSSNIEFNQQGKKRRIEGDITLKKLNLLYEAKFLDPAHDSDVVIIDKKNKNVQTDDSFLNDTYINLSIYAPDAQYNTKDIKLTFSVDVNAKKEFGNTLGMFGKIKEINGRVEQAPKLFTIVDSSIVFRGLKEINPLLDIQVQHELPDVLIFIDIHGDAKRPKLEFSSDPQMPKKDILSYLLLGVSTAKLSDKDTNLGREAELFIMNQAARDLAYELDLDRVFITDDGTGEGYAIQVGKKINKKTMFVVESSKEGNSFILEYDVNKNIKVEVGQHQKTIPSQSIDIFFRKRFR